LQTFPTPVPATPEQSTHSFQEERPITARVATAKNTFFIFLFLKKNI
jgi:hypothetical protein